MLSAGPVRPAAFILIFFLFLGGAWTEGCARDSTPTEAKSTGQPARELHPQDAAHMPPPAAGSVHRTSLPGSWYPADAGTLRKSIRDYLEQADPPDAEEASQLVAIIVPHAGHRYSGGCAAYAYRVLQQRRPRRVVLMGPSHRTAFRGVSLGNYEAYETPLGQIPVDPEARRLLQGCPLVRFLPRAHKGEHSVDIQLPFLQVLSPDAALSIVPLVVGHLEPGDYTELARCLRPLLDDQTVLVVSSDFTHYGSRFGYTPFPAGKDVADRIRVLDDGACQAILRIDREAFLGYQKKTGITVCGAQPIALLLEVLPRDTQAKQLFYAASGAMTGGYDNSVSYTALSFFRKGLWGQAPNKGVSSARRATTMKESHHRSRVPEEGEHMLSESEKATLLKIARETLESYVRNKDTPDLSPSRYVLTPAMGQERGAFVTLTSHGKLRGCIGYILPVAPLSETVQQNAINAATRDPRFSRVKPDELADIHIEISALSRPREVASYRDILLGEHGIILRKGSRKAVFLPQVAPEQGWDLPETLRHLSLKAGLAQDDWKDPETQFSVFTAEVFEEPKP